MSARCGRAIPVVVVPSELLKSYGWQPWQLSSVVEWCGYLIEGIPVPTADSRWRLIVVAGDAVDHGGAAFQRNFALPDGVDAAQVEAKYTKGMLEVRVPAPQAATLRTIEVKAA